MADVNEIKETIYTSDKTNISLASGGGVSHFSTPRRQKVEHMRVYFSPKQGGSGTPSPDNIRPIEGWTGVEIQHCGKNLCVNKIQYTGNHVGEANQLSNMDVIIYGGSVSVGYPIDLKKDSTVTFSCNLNYTPVNSFIRQRVYKYITESSIERVANNIIDSDTCKMTFTAQEDGRYIFIIYAQNYENEAPNSEIIVSNWQVEYGSEVTKYEPPYFKSYGIDWSEDVGTVYGGYVDLVKGEVVEDVSMPTSWTATKNGAVNENGFITYKADNSYTRSTNPVYEMSNSISTYGSIAIQSVNERMIERASGSVWVALPQDENVNDIQYAYKIANPIHHSFTPQQFKILRGMNIISSNTNDNIEIIYWTH